MKDCKLVAHLVGNDVDTLYEDRKYLVGFNFIRAYRYRYRSVLDCTLNLKLSLSSKTKRISFFCDQTKRISGVLENNSLFLFLRKRTKNPFNNLVREVLKNRKLLNILLYS